MHIKKILTLFVLALSQTAQAGTYDFKKLHHDLGYEETSNYFGASPEAIDDLSQYTDKFEDYFAQINGYLRFYPHDYEWSGVGPNEAKIMVSKIDEIFIKIPPLPSDIILFRGLTMQWHHDLPFEIGEEYEDKAYISTTTTKSIAEYFGNGMNKDEQKEKGTVLALYFNSPESKGILIDQENEDEVMLQHDQKFRMMERQLGSKNNYYLVQICGPKQCSTEEPAFASKFWKSLNE